MDEPRRFTVGLPAAVLAALFALWTSTALAVAPANDDFANRQVLSGPLPIEMPGTNEGATKESDESLGSFSAAGHSVWFEWEAPASEWVTIGSCTGTLYPLVGIFEGMSLGALTKIVRSDFLDHSAEGQNCGWIEREYTIWATAGQHYVVAVDGSTNPSIQPPAREGSFLLHIESTPVPPNDDFDAATSIEGEFFGVEPNGFYRAETPGYNWGATKEVGEPDHAGDPGGASVWYSWTAPASGLAEFRTSCCPVWPPVLGVYRGDAVSGLTVVGGGEEVTVPVTQGESYEVAVDGLANSGEGVLWMGSFLVSVEMKPPAVLPIGGPLSSPPPPQALDTSPPGTAIVKRDLAASKRRATFDFRATEPGSSFQCKLDERPFATCRSPKTYRRLSVGRHTFAVKALDPSGNRDPTPAISRFRVASTGR
jgi:hypothetical protein